MLADADGKWPGWFHHQTIENTFRNRGAHTVAVLQAASDWVDSWGAGNQDPTRAFMHAMSDGQRRQSVADAERETNTYINEEVIAAVNVQLRYESGGGKGDSDTVLTHFGHALHTVTDRTSLQHAGYQPWSCLLCFSAYQHQRAEERSARSPHIADALARHQAYVEAARLWQQYQARLETERKRRKEKEQEERENREKSVR